MARLNEEQLIILNDFKASDGFLNAEEKIMFDEAKESYIKIVDGEVINLKDKTASKLMHNNYPTVPEETMLKKVPYVRSFFKVKEDRVWIRNEVTKSSRYNTFELNKTMMNGCKEARDNLGLLNETDFIKKYRAFNMLFDNLFGRDETMFERDYIINYLSTIINTREKLPVAIILKGRQGPGKGVIEEHLLRPLFHYLVSLETEDLEDKDNKMLNNAVFVVFNEVETNLNKATDNRIKKIVSDKTIKVKMLYVNPVIQYNQFNVWFFTNKDKPFKIEFDDRRQNVIETKDKDLKIRCKEEFGLTIDEFLAELDAELPYFIQDLKRYNYSKERAIQAIDNESKQKIAISTMTKVEILTRRLQDVDYNSLEVEILEALEGESYNEFDMNQLNLLRENMKNGFINSDNNLFLYKLYIDDRETSKTKIGRFFSGILGAPKKIGGKSVRVLRHKFVQDVETDLQETYINIDGTETRQLRIHSDDEVVKVIEQIELDKKETIEKVKNKAISDEKSSLQIKEDEIEEFIKDQEEKGNVMF